jgi:hypothetical protein
MPATTNPRLDAAIAAASTAADTSPEGVVAAALAAADAVMFSDDRIEFLALLIAGIKFPDMEWAELNEHTRRLARRIARDLATDLKAGL